MLLEIIYCKNIIISDFYYDTDYDNIQRLCTSFIINICIYIYIMYIYIYIIVSLFKVSF